MTEKLDESWQPLSEITPKLLAKWDDEQRRFFRRNVEQDGIKVQSQQAAE